MAEISPEIWLIRRGETEWSRAGRHTKRIDLPLTPPDARQAAELGRHLGGRRFALVLAGPLGRVQETCRLARYTAAAAPMEDLSVWDRGDYEGWKPDWRLVWREPS